MKKITPLENCQQSLRKMKELADKHQISGSNFYEDEEWTRAEDEYQENIIYINGKSRRTLEIQYYGIGADSPETAQRLFSVSLAEERKGIPDGPRFRTPTYSHETSTWRDDFIAY
ncbi:MAG: hypothetical protein ACOCUU_03675 [Nanoarchaeota archaeon]